ncbi:MAG: hypothetical protein ACOX2L_06235 [Anaerolineae bacterium]|jgi:hypothetical protein|nr:hypothetical protein [Chloroflexota bacterium]
MTDETVPSSNHIGQLNEHSLHAALKEWCTRPGDTLESRVGNYVVDVVRDGLLIEVQTRGLGAIRRKLVHLAAEHRVRVVYPLVVSKSIVTYDADGETVLRNRRSPLRHKWPNLFDELVRAPELMATPGLELLAVQVQVTEMRCADGSGSWRRKGVRVVDTRLEGISETRLFTGLADWLSLLPSTLPQPFTHRQLASAMGVRITTARRASYCFRQLSVLREAGRAGNALLLELAPIERVAAEQNAAMST